MEAKTAFTRRKKVVALILMILSMNTIYTLPYLTYSYYTPLQKALGLIGQDAKLGTLLNIYGIANVILYLPGGWIADRFDAKKLLVISMVGTGVLGIWESFFPSYGVMVLIYLLFAVTTVLTFWSSSVKCVNIIAENEQGGMFSMLEAGRGVAGLLIATLFVVVFTKTQSVYGVVLGASLLMVAVGLALAFLLPNTSTKGSTNKTFVDSIKAYGIAFKNPSTYLLAGMIFTGSITIASSSYFAPYLERVLQMNQNHVIIFQNYNRLLCQLIIGSIAAVLSKKLGRSSRPMIYAGIAGIITSALLFILPGTHQLLIPLLILMVLVIMGATMFRALYYATLDESGCPTNTVGAVVGIASLLGFIPDTFYTTLCGTWLDNYGVAGFKYIFASTLASMVLGLICAFISDRRIAKHKASLSENKKA